MGIVLVAAMFLFALGVAALLAPVRARRFLLGFAGSATKHMLEMSLRLLIGAAFLVAAPRMAFTDVFRLFGGVLLATTAVLLCLPWRWHRHFAARAVPQALRFLPVIGFASIALGAFVLWAIWRGVPGT